MTAAGIGATGIADDDRIEISKSNHQILHKPSRIGMLEVDYAKQTLTEFDKSAEISIYPVRFGPPSDLVPLLTEFDVVIDCTDNYPTRYLINDSCIQAKNPGFMGQYQVSKGRQCQLYPAKDRAIAVYFRHPLPQATQLLR